MWTMLPDYPELSALRPKPSHPFLPLSPTTQRGQQEFILSLGDTVTIDSDHQGSVKTIPVIHLWSAGPLSECLFLPLTLCLTLPFSNSTPSPLYYSALPFRLQHLLLNQVYTILSLPGPNTHTYSE